MMKTFSDPHGQTGLPRPNDFGRALKAMALAALDGRTIDDVLDQHYAGLPDLNRKTVHRILAAGVPPTTTGESIASGQAQTGLTWSTILQSLSGVMDVAASTSIPYYMRGSATQAVIHVPGKAIPVLRGDFHRIDMTPKEAAAIIYGSRSWLEQPSTEPCVRACLRDAVTKCVDETFVAAALGTNDSPIASGASTPVELLNHLNVLISALVAAGADVRHIGLAANPALCVQLALTSTAAGERAFPDITVQGGTLGGLPLLASQGVAAGTIVAFSGADTLRSPMRTRLEASRNGAIEADDAPTGFAEADEEVTSASANLISMFTTESVAIKAVTEFACGFIGDMPAAFIDGIDLAGSTA